MQIESQVVHEALRGALDRCLIVDVYVLIGRVVKFESRELKIMSVSAEVNLSLPVDDHRQASLI